MEDSQLLELVCAESDGICFVLKSVIPDPLLLLLGFPNEGYLLQTLCHWAPAGRMHPYCDAFSVLEELFLPTIQHLYMYKIMIVGITIIGSSCWPEITSLNHLL